LEEHGIRAFVTDEYFSALKYANLSTVKLQVAVADAERARELLHSATGAQDSG
jgi:hypothetical protein